MGVTIDQFHPAFQWAVQQALAACPGARIDSGWRSPDEQDAAIARMNAGGPTAAPQGQSRHQSDGMSNFGGAVDIGGDRDCFANAAAALGLERPIDGEPWHFQFTDEAWQSVLDGTYQGGQFGTESATPEPPEDSLAGLRAIIFGQGEGTQAQDIPARAATLGPDEPEAPATQPGTFTPEASAGFTPGTGAISATEAARYYAAAGFTGDALVNMVAIAIGESGLDPGIHGDTSLTNGTWGPSIGLSQIRSLNEQRGTGGWRDATRLTDPAFNAQAAYAISNNGTNFSPWTVWNEGIYKQYLAQAEAAVAALGSGMLQGVSVNPPAASVETNDYQPDADVLDPAGLANEIAAMVLANRRDPGQMLEDRVTEPASEALGEETETPAGGFLSRLRRTG